MTGSQKLIASLEGYFGPWKTPTAQGECLRWLELQDLSSQTLSAMYNNLISRHPIRFGNCVGLAELIESRSIAYDQVVIEAPMQVFFPAAEAVPRESEEAAREFAKVFNAMKRAQRPPRQTDEERRQELSDQARFVIGPESGNN
jgi:hypothetical protein